MHMFTERLQVLISREQRRRLEAEARRRRTSVGAVIRDAIDVRLGGASRERRARAVAEIRAMVGGRFLPADVLDRVVEEEREDTVRALNRRRR